MTPTPPPVLAPPPPIDWSGPGSTIGRGLVLCRPMVTRTRPPIRPPPLMGRLRVQSNPGIGRIEGAM